MLYCRFDALKTHTLACSHTWKQFQVCRIGHWPHPGWWLVWLILPVLPQEGQPSLGPDDPVLHCSNPVCSRFIHHWIRHQWGQRILYMMNIHSLLTSWHCCFFLVLLTAYRTFYMYIDLFMFLANVVFYIIYFYTPVHSIVMFIVLVHSCRDYSSVRAMTKMCQMYFICMPTWPWKLILIFYKVFIMCFYVKCECKVTSNYGWQILRNINILFHL